MTEDRDYWLRAFAESCRTLHPSELTTSQLMAITTVLQAFARVSNATVSPPTLRLLTATDRKA